jgi:hypothetical protein
MDNIKIRYRLNNMINKNKVKMYLIISHKMYTQLIHLRKLIVIIIMVRHLQIL